MIRIKALAPQSMNYDMFKEGIVNPQSTQNANYEWIHTRQKTAKDLKRSLEENEPDDELVNMYHAPEIQNWIKPNTMRSSDMFKIHKHRISSQISGQNIGNFKVNPPLINQKIKKLDLQVDTESRSKKIFTKFSSRFSPQVFKEKVLQ